MTDTLYRANMNPREKVAFVSEHGREEYEALPLSAEEEARKSAPLVRSRMTPREKVDYVQQHGREEYEALPLYATE